MNRHQWLVIFYSCLVFVSASWLSDRVSAAVAPSIGHIATPAEIAPIDIDVSPDGSGLPSGRGNAVDGAHVFETQCLRCHIDGIAISPVRWAYATTVFDYVRRAMPPGRKQTLSNDDVYSVTAFLLFKNGLIDEHDVLNRATVPKIVSRRLKDFIRDN